MKEKTIILPSDVEERKNILEAELGKVIEEKVRTYLYPYLNSENALETLDREGYGKIKSLNFDTCQEYNDEGGTDTHIDFIELVDVNGRVVNAENIVFKEKSKFSDNVWETSLTEIIIEEMWSFDLDQVVDLIGHTIDLLGGE